MKVSRLLDYLRFGELSDLAVSDISVQANLDKIFTYINRGLKKVNSELNILEEEAAFTVTTGVYTYEITDPLILRVTAVYDQAGVELPLDVEGDPRSVFTSSYNKISFVGHRDDPNNKVTALSVIYLKDFSEITAVTDEISISDFAEEIIKLTGTDQKVIYKDLPVNDPKQRQPDITKARKILGWEPKIDRAEGLKITYAYFKSLSTEELNKKEHNNFDKYVK